MFGIYDDNTIKMHVHISGDTEQLKNYNSSIGGYVFELNNGEKIEIDWCDYEGYYDEKDDLFKLTAHSLDYECFPRLKSIDIDDLKDIKEITEFYICDNFHDSFIISDIFFTHNEKCVKMDSSVLEKINNIIQGE